MDCQELIYGFLEASLQEEFVSAKRNPSGDGGSGSRISRDEAWWEMKPMNSVKEEQCPNPFVKVVAPTPKDIKVCPFLEQVLEGKGEANGIERLVTDCRIGRRDDV